MTAIRPLRVHLLLAVCMASESGSPDVTLNVLERYGHLDVIVGELAARDVFQPIADWIKVRTAVPSTPSRVSVFPTATDRRVFSARHRQDRRRRVCRR